MTYSTIPGRASGHIPPLTARSQTPANDGMPYAATSIRPSQIPATDAKGSRICSYGISAQLADGTISEFDHLAPAELSLEDICANVARGTLIATRDGDTAVEDLRPGDLIKTRDNGYVALRWISCCTLPDQGGNDGGPHHPLRIRADALGYQRPSHDLLVSPRFRYLSNHPSCTRLYGSPETLAPVVDLVDDGSVLRVRPSPDLMFYNLMFDRHQIFMANGLETESYHPGEYGVSMLTLEQVSHLRRILVHLGGDLGKLGPMARPALRGFEGPAPRRAG